MIVFGGISSVATGERTNDETWSFDYDTRTWTRMRPSMAPRARQTAFMAYDEARDRSVLFGGAVSFSGLRLSDTWTYDGAANVWTLVDDEPANIEREAIRQLRSFKTQALARGDDRFVESFDEAERSLWK